SWGAVGDPQDRDDERDVGLDGGHDIAGRAVLLAHETEHAVARLGERREGLEGLEGGREPPSVAFGGLARRGRRGLGPARNRIQCSFHAGLFGLPWLWA